MTTAGLRRLGGLAAACAGIVILLTNAIEALAT